MELLERTDELAALAASRESAASGNGRVVLVTGEPGIGKTSLVTAFVRSLGEDARVLWGTCDDLAIPRPLGAFRDLAEAVSPRLEGALSGDAGPHQIQGLLLEELERPPRPTVLVLEDVHWADEATLDVITVLGRRIRSLPAVVVLTFRGGEHRRTTHCTLPSELPAQMHRCSSSSRRCRRARSHTSPGTTPMRCTR